MVAIGYAVGLVLVVAAAAWWALRRWRSRLHAEAACAKCGYLTRGLPGLCCPECGSDLREVGIRGPGVARSRGVLATAITWTLFVGLAGVTITIALAPMEEAEGIRFCLSRPKSDMYQDASASTFGRRLVWPWTTREYPIAPSSIGVSIWTTSGAPWTPTRRFSIQARPGSGRYRVSYNDQQRTFTEEGDLDEGPILRAFEDCGYGAPTPELKAEAREIVAALRLALRGCTKAPASAAFGGISEQGGGLLLHDVEWFNGLAAAFWGLVWFVGCVFMFWPGRKARRIKN